MSVIALPLPLVLSLNSLLLTALALAHLVSVLTAVPPVLPIAHAIAPLPVPVLHQSNLAAIVLALALIITVMVTLFLTQITANVLAQMPKHLTVVLTTKFLQLANVLAIEFALLHLSVIQPLVSVTVFAVTLVLQISDKTPLVDVNVI